MSILQPVLVTRRFWPTMDGAARTMANLAVELRGRGMPVTILTVQQHPKWPAKICYRGASVVRIPCPRGHWRSVRYVQLLARWLRRNRDRYNLVYVSSLKHDACAALWAVGGRVPVVLRAERAGCRGDCLWQLDAVCGRRIKRRCMKADALIGPSRQIDRELIAAGYPRSCIHHIPHGVPIPAVPSVRAKTDARAALAGSRPALELPSWGPLAVYTGRLHRSKGLLELVAAWKPIVTRWPNARLWLAGEGPYRAELQAEIKRSDLAGRVALIGTFDHVDELLAAADLFVLPPPEEDMSVALLEAMAAGLPIVAADIPGNRDLVVDGKHALLMPPGHTVALSEAIHRLLDEPGLATRLGAAARDRATNHFPLAKMVDTHISLFEGLVHPDAAGKRS